MLLQENFENTRTGGAGEEEGEQELSCCTAGQLASRER